MSNISFDNLNVLRVAHRNNLPVSLDYFNHSMNGSADDMVANVVFKGDDGGHEVTTAIVEHVDGKGFTVIGHQDSINGGSIAFFEDTPTLNEAMGIVTNAITSSCGIEAPLALAA
jgi:hypothetical protein